jgi:hypothetical protein
MVRFLFNRAWWSGILFGAAMVGFAVMLVVPSSSAGLTSLPFSATMAAVLSLVIQATLPLILVLRRTRSHGPEALLADVFLPRACMHGRPVWLENPRDELVHGQLQRYSPQALVGQIFALVLVCPSLLHAYSLVSLCAIIVLVLLGSTALLDASVGNSCAHAAAFLVAAASTGPISPALPAFGQFLRFVPGFAVAYGIVFFLWSVGRGLAVSKQSPFNNCVRNVFDRLWLLAEMYLPLCFGTRFIHGGPAVIRELASTDESWRMAVLLILKRSRFALMDISGIEATSELAWELVTCYEHKTKLLLTCDISESDNALHCIRVVVPEAVILPMDFRNLEMLKTVGKPGVAIVQLFTYGQGGDMERFYAQAGVFFGQVSLSEWFSAIRSRT